MKSTLKNTLRSVFMMSIIFFTMFNSALAQDAEPDFMAILQSIDERSNFTGDLAATIALETKDPQEGNESSQIQLFRRDSDELFLILIQKPETQLGQGYLRVEDSLWFYDPESRQFNFTSLSDNFQGSDARNSDFEASNLARDYKVLSYSEAKLGKFDVWQVELEATNNEVTYPFVTLSITKENHLVLKSEDYSLTKRLLRTSYYPSYTKAGDNFIADKAIFVDALVEGKSTSFTMSNISVAPIPDNVFTKAYVERVNR